VHYYTGDQMVECSCFGAFIAS